MVEGSRAKWVDLATQLTKKKSLSNLLYTHTQSILGRLTPLKLTFHLGIKASVLCNRYNSREKNSGCCFVDLSAEIDNPFSSISMNKSRLWIN